MMMMMILNLLILLSAFINVDAGQIGALKYGPNHRVFAFEERGKKPKHRSSKKYGQSVK